MIDSKKKAAPLTCQPPAKPFLKWAGGKGQLLEKFRELYPHELKSGKIKNYYEPFIGGGAVFFDIVQKFPIAHSFLSDINEELILVYKVIRNDAENLIELLGKYEEDYLLLKDDKRKEYFYKQREAFNQKKNQIDLKKFSSDWIERAAQTIFLNKTCFNGLFRFNNSGDFNTPAGDYKNPKICDKINIKNASGLLQNAEIKCIGFKEISENIGENSFVYFDPPYRPISNTASFTAYSKHDFTDEHQKQLAKVFKELDKRGCKLLLSNSDPKNINPTDNFFDTLYEGYNIRRIPARRNINSVASKRGLLNEIVVTNY